MDDYRLEDEENRAAAANQHTDGSGELSIHQHMQIAKSVASRCRLHA